MGLAFFVLAFGVKVPFFNGNITARLLIRTRRVGFLRRDESVCLPKENGKGEKTKSADRTHDLSPFHSSWSYWPSIVEVPSAAERIFHPQGAVFSFINKIGWDEHKRDNLYQAGRPARTRCTPRSGTARLSGGGGNLSEPHRRAGARPHLCPLLRHYIRRGRIQGGAAHSQHPAKPFWRRRALGIVYSGVRAAGGAERPRRGRPCGGRSVFSAGPGHFCAGAGGRAGHALHH